MNAPLTGSAGLAAATGAKPSSNYAWMDVPQDRLVRKESALGFIRELVPPTEHIGLSEFAPWMDVPTDEVIFEYLTGLTDGLAPARAEDAEAELAQKDYLYTGQGRASVVDWAIKDHYTASDVNRFREAEAVAQAMANNGNLPLFVSSVTEGFQARIARDDALRRRKLDNRIEKLIMDAVSSGVISYNDGRVQFSVDFERPTAQQAGHADNDLGSLVTNGVFAMNNTTFDPIGLINAIQEKMYDLYGVIPKRVLCSRKFLNRVFLSDKFIARTGFVVGGNPSSPIDLNYLVDGWGPGAALEVVSRATGVRFIEYDAVYRTRPIGSKTVTNNRFFPENRLVFLPDEADLAEFDSTGIGFGKTLTSPHPEGNWSSGWYEWEAETRDPWAHTRGTGVKAFPVFLHMDKTYAVDVTF